MYGDGMSSCAVQSNLGDAATGTCRHCLKSIRRNSGGVWGARKRDDPHPWYCDASPDGAKRHEPGEAS